MHYNAIFWVIIAIVSVSFVWGQIRAALNRSMMSDELPPQLVGIYEPDEYARQQQYQRVDGKFSLISRSASTLLMLAALFTGALGLLEARLSMVTTNHVLLPLLVMLVIAVVLLVLDLPFDYYDTFVIEERFGFNKSSKLTFFMDALKELLLTSVLMGVVVAVIAFLYQLSPTWFWLWAWAALTFFSVGLSYFYSQLIVPLFNKQTPLEEGALRDALMHLAEQTDFPISEVFVIDGSKRSTKANAYFAGFGKRKRICLYDTLIDDLEVEEIVAVLAHEIGHYKKRHIPINIALTVGLMGMQLWLMSLLLGSAALATAMGSTTGAPSLILGLIAFSLLFGPVSELLSVGQNMLSRRFEYQADAYAARFGYGQALINGLCVISSKALSNMTPHPVVVFWTYSHPTVLQRMQALGIAHFERKTEDEG
ncbi:MAG: M48 family metallopeptidase [Coriobacteriia bacterium]|nr:M48 family metallopeptidase [Coriobacteriia bacterium]MCL2536826.1 M48 family metallopeptidase [Coriobacteriia bacterium]